MIKPSEIPGDDLKEKSSFYQLLLLEQSQHKDLSKMKTIAETLG